MSITMLNNMINPQVMGKMIEAYVKELLYAPLLKIDNTLQGQPGDTVTLPVWQYIGKADKYGEGESLIPTILTTTSKTAKIGKAGKAVTLTEESLLSGLGNPLDTAVVQIKDAIRELIDEEVRLALLSVGDNMTVDLSTESFGADAIAQSLVKYGQKLKETKLAFIAPQQLADCRKSPDFVKASDIGQKILMDGTVGMIHGCQLVVSEDIVPVAGIYENVIVKPGAVTLYKKSDIIMKQEEDTLADTITVSGRQHYVVYLNDESKVIKVKTQATIA